MVQPHELIETARTLARLRVRYMHQGRTVHGLDCIGMILYVLSKHDALPVDFERRNYGRLPMAELLQKASTYCHEILEPVDGCLVLVQWPGDSRPSHAALYASGNLIHCYAGIGRVVEHGFRQKWVKWATNFYKLPGVNYE